eukprot:5885250-Pyramimonas_sp.AAC.1
MSTICTTQTSYQRWTPNHYEGLRVHIIQLYPTKSLLYCTAHSSTRHFWNRSSATLLAEPIVRNHRASPHLELRFAKRKAAR